MPRKLIYLITLGFDEKFALRALIRRGLGHDDEVLAVMARPSDERAEKAYRQLTEILRRIFQHKRTSRIDIDPRDFPHCLKDLIEALAPSIKEKHVLVLSGGFRALILETLLAATMLNLQAEVEVEFEDSSTTITFPLKWVTPLNLEDDELNILKYAANTPTLSGLTKEVGLSKSTVWRKIKKLQELGILNYNGKEVSPTELGNLALLIAQLKGELTIQ